MTEIRYENNTVNSNTKNKNYSLVWFIIVTITQSTKQAAVTVKCLDI